jgi:hypothetical protein
MIEDTMNFTFGTVKNVRNVKTSTGRKMVTFTIDESPCKASGEIATAIEKLEDYLVEVIVQEGSFKGAPEYLVTKVEPILVPVRPLTPDELKHERWRRRISRACARPAKGSRKLTK